MRIALSVALFLLATAPTSTQTGTVAPPPFQTFLDNSGNIVNGGCVWTYAAGTSTELATYTDQTLATPNTNPIRADSAGRFVAYLAPRSYKFVYENMPCDDSPVLHGPVLKTVDNVSAMPPFFVDLDVDGLAGETLLAGDAVYLSNGSGGLNAGRWYKADADNGYSSSTAGAVGVSPSALAVGVTGSIRLQGRVTGLAGLTAGSVYYASATAGTLTSTAPANARAIGTADSTTTLVVGATTAGAVDIGGALDVGGALTTGGAATVGGLFSVTGSSGTHNVTAGTASGLAFNVRNTTSGTAATSFVSVGNNDTASLGLFRGYSSAFTTNGFDVASGVTLESTGAGGLSIAASHASGVLRFYPSGNTERWRLTASAFLAQQSAQVFGVDSQDGSDSASLDMSGGPVAATTRGAWFSVRGNEHATTPGVAQAVIGNVAGGKFRVLMPDESTSAFEVAGADGAATFGMWAKLTPRGAAPGTPAAGMLYVDSTPTPNELCFYDGSAWQGISSGTDANCN